MDMSHTGYFYFFLQLATQHFVAVAGFRTGVVHVNSFLQLVSRQKVARKIVSCNMALSDSNIHIIIVIRIHIFDTFPLTVEKISTDVVPTFNSG